jgi:flagellar motor component MotA
MYAVLVDNHLSQGYVDTTLWQQQLACATMLAQLTFIYHAQPLVKVIKDGMKSGKIIMVPVDEYRRQIDVSLILISKMEKPQDEDIIQRLEKQLSEARQDGMRREKERITALELDLKNEQDHANKWRDEFQQTQLVYYKCLSSQCN